MGEGNIVLLNGTSSAGKSSIARALQDVMERPYLHTGVDHYLGRLPATCTVISDGVDPATADYFLLVYAGGSERIVTEAEGGVSVHGTSTLSEVRIGPGGIRLLAGMYLGVASMAAAGVDVIVDDVIYDWRVLDVAVNALRDSQVLFVGLQLPLEVAERRERERGNRGPGGAAAFYHLVHAHGSYDLELDTAAASPMECALRIKRALENGFHHGAIRRLAEAT